MPRSTSTFSPKLFIAYLAILCWAPLPFGSNRPWASLLISFLIFSLALAMLVQTISGKIAFVPLLKRYRTALLILLLVPVWVTLQSTPLPASIVAWLSPTGFELWRDSGIDSGWLTLSLEPGATQQQALLSWAFWVFFIITLLLVDSYRRLRRLMIVIVGCGVFQALYGSLMTLSGLELGFFMEKIDYRGVATGTFINRNHLAGYLEMCLAMGIGLLVASLSQDNKRSWRHHLRNLLDTLLGPKMRLRIYLALMVIALVLTRSRMGNTAFFASLPICGFLLLALQRRLTLGPILLFASLLLVDFVIVGQWFGFDELINRLESTSTQSESRDEVIRDSLPMIEDYLVAGTGAGTFYSSYPQYRSSEVRIFYDHAHNDYVEFTSTFGLLGLMPLALSVVLAIMTSLQVLYRRRNQRALGAAFASLMGVLALLIHSVTDFNLQIPSNAVLFILLLAMAQLADKLGRRRSTHGSAGDVD